MQAVEAQLSKLSTEAKVSLLRNIYAQDAHRYFKNLVYSLDEHDKSGNAIKKLPYEWPYIQDLVNQFLTEPWLLVWKSRQILATWVAVAYCLWIALFHEGKKVAVQSKKSDDAEALIQRMKVIYDKLPAWKPKAEFSYCRIKIPEMHSDVYGIAAGGDQVRSYTFSCVLSDEFGFQDHLQETFGAVKPIVDGGGQFIAVTTPPREKNFSYKCKQNDKAKSPDGLFKVFEIHYSSRPDRGEGWKAKAKLGMSEDDWNREYELQMVQSGVTRALSDFSEKRHVNPGLLYNRDSMLVRGWDFGFHRPACVIGQIDQQDRFNVLFSVLGKDIIIDKFIEQMLAVTSSRFPEASCQDFCDPAGTQVNDKSEKTSIQILQASGITPRYRKSNIEDGLSLIRRKMVWNIGDRPAFQVHPHNAILIDGMLFGYIYGRDGKSLIGDGMNEDGDQEKDYYTHLIDALRYIFINLYTIQGARQNSMIKTSAIVSARPQRQRGR